MSEARRKYATSELPPYFCLNGATVVARPELLPRRWAEAELRAAKVAGTAKVASTVGVLPLADTKASVLLSAPSVYGTASEAATTAMAREERESGEGMYEYDEVSEILTSISQRGASNAMLAQEMLKGEGKRDTKLERIRS